MTSIVRLDEWIKEGVEQQLAALQAAEPDWPETTQIQFLRLLIERGLDRLAALDDDHYNFMTECALMAGENMQDARLQFLEERVDELENPPFSLGDVLFDAALILAGELIIAGAAYWAVPALFVLAQGSRMRKLRREMVTVNGYSRRLSEVRTEIQSHIAAQERIGRGLLKDMQAVGWKNWDNGLHLKSKVDAFKRAIAKDREHLRFIDAALETSDEVAARVADAIAIEAHLKPNLSGLKQSFSDFLEGVYGSVVVGRLGETTGEQMAELSKQLWSAPEVAEFRSFESSGMVGEFLNVIAQDRFTSRETISDLRFHIRFVPDERFLESDAVRELLAMAKASEFDTQVSATQSSNDRNVFVLAFEVLLWKFWFAYNNMLRIEPFESVDQHDLHHVGEAFDGHLVKEHYQAKDPVAVYYYMFGDFYPGAARLNEEQAEYLFNKFARQHFIRNPGHVPEVLRSRSDAAAPFDTARYDQLWQLPETHWFGMKTNSDRAARLEEVKILVVEYFRQTADQLQASDDADGTARKIRETVREMLGLESHEDPLQEVIDRQPNIPGPSETLNLSANETADLSTLADALAAAGLETRWSIGDSRTQLESALTDLDLKVTAYELDSTTALDGDALGDIEARQSLVEARYADFLTLAQDDGGATTRVETELGPRIRELLAWRPETNNGWTWYGDDNASPPTS